MRPNLLQRVTASNRRDALLLKASLRLGRKPYGLKRSGLPALTGDVAAAMCWGEAA